MGSSHQTWVGGPGSVPNPFPVQTVSTTLNTPPECCVTQQQLADATAGIQDAQDSADQANNAAVVAADAATDAQDSAAAAQASATDAAASAAAVPRWWQGTQAQYDAIPVKDPETLYIITG